MKKEEVDDFDKQFPSKAKYITKSQQVFNIVSGAKVGDEIHF